MKYGKPGPFYQLRLDRGEDVPTALAAFVGKLKVGSAIVTGLGAARMVELGYFDARRRVYCRRWFPGDYELASITGNVAWDGREPVCHLHAVISGPRMTTHAGHLFAAEVTATCEFALLPGRQKLRRGVDPVTGLKLLDLPSV